MKQKNINKPHIKGLHLCNTHMHYSRLLKDTLVVRHSHSADGVWLPHIPGSAALFLAAGSWEVATAQHALVNKSKGKSRQKLILF